MANTRDTAPPTMVALKGNEVDALDAIGAYERTKDISCLYKKIVILASCQIGSKFLQRIFSRSVHRLDRQIFAEVLQDVDRLMVDQYGNYFVQTLIESLDRSDRVRLIENVRHFI